MALASRTWSRSARTKRSGCTGEGNPPGRSYWISNWPPAPVVARPRILVVPCPPGEVADRVTWYPTRPVAALSTVPRRLAPLARSTLSSISTTRAIGEQERIRCRDMMLPIRRCRPVRGASALPRREEYTRGEKYSGEGDARFADRLHGALERIQSACPRSSAGVSLVKKSFVSAR